MNAGILAPGYAPPQMPRPLLGVPQPVPTPYGRGGDPYWGSVSLLLRMDGPHGSTTFSDLSPNRVTITRNGDTQITAATGVFGAPSATLDGTGDYLSASGSGFAPGTGPFTVEAFVRFLALPGANGYAGICNTQTSITGATTAAWWFGLQNVSGTCNLGFSRHGDSAMFARSAFTPSIGQWYYVAATKDSDGTIRLYVDNRQLSVTQSSAASWAANNFSQTNFAIGLIATPFYMTGAISNLRITKGVARYTTGFAMPTAPFPDRYQ